MKRQNSVYEAPCLEVTELQMEQCILSASYGDAGAAGQRSGYVDWDENDLL